MSHCGIVQDACDDIHEDAVAAHGNANRLPKRWASSTTPGAPNSCSSSRHQDQLPLVSIVLPVYNGEGFLQECLHSIAMQSHRPLELAVCDNGSSDRTPQILAAWRPKLEAAGIQYVHVTTGDADPRGCGYGRNRCIEAASGVLFECDAEPSTAHVHGACILLLVAFHLWVRRASSACMYTLESKG